MGDLTWFEPDELSTPSARLPLAGESPATGFPSPAADYEEDAIDLNRLLMPRPASTFLMRVSGDAMGAAGIHHGDLLIIDRSLGPPLGLGGGGGERWPLRVAPLGPEPGRYRLVPGGGRSLAAADPLGHGRSGSVDLGRGTPRRASPGLSPQAPRHQRQPSWLINNPSITMKSISST